MRWKSRPFLAMPMSAVLAASVVPAVDAAASAERPGKVSALGLAPAPVAATRTITLITGDRVQVRNGSVSVLPGPGRANVGFLQQQAGSHVVVLPMDAAPLVTKGRLDRRLFDVGRLLNSGYDDARAAALPLSVTGSAAARLPGIKTTGRDSVSLAKKSATPFWHALRATPGDVKVRLAGVVPSSPKRRQGQPGAQAEHGVKVDLLDRNGRPPSSDEVGEWSAYSLDDPWGIYGGRPGETLQLPAGRYMVAGFISTDRPGNANPAVAGMVDTEVVVDRDRTITFDARKARRVEVNADRPSARKTSWIVGLLAKAAPNPDYTYFRWNVNMPFGAQMYASATAPSPRFAFTAQATYQEPLLRLETGGAQPFPVDVHYSDLGYGDGPRLEGTNRLSAVYGGSGTPGELHDVAGKLVVLDLPPADDLQTPERVRNVAEAGGRAVLLVRDTVGPDLEGELALPTAVTLVPEGARLRDLAKTGPVPVTTHGIKVSPYQYNLYYPTVGRLPARPVYTAREQDLAAVRVRYRGAGGDLPSSLLTETVGFGNTSGGWFVPVPAPTTRTEYFSTGSRFTRVVINPYDDGRPLIQTETRTYRPGERREETMYKGVMGPSFATPPRDEDRPGRPAWAYREGDRVDVAIQAFSDTEPGHYGHGEPYAPGCTTGSARLLRDGKPVGESDLPAAGAFTAPPEAGAYRLDIEAACDHPDWKLSTRVTSSWTFRSAHASRPTALPLMAVRFLPELDDVNQAPAGKPFTFPVRVEHQPGSTSARVTSLTIESSTDEGQQWQPVRIRQSGDHWVAELHNPPKGKVSLRATAKDASGNTVTQTIENAYAVTS
ncbi:protease-associated domain-containing protein [Actinomadura rudentiformis]|uniref:PA domain-containing protein n=1 Tax=Actinomadura rudentiformis TaxID=359158 RepID=A0A6H9YWC7_9ACTN|nr:hypothetical protein [Actinomadura rudentiformis]KAB2350287.1 hypothetical protein F8566_10940 [Actinomadura rudentiformis]